MVEGLPAIRMREDGSCIFLDQQTTLCTIYAARPYDCNAFPFDFISRPNGDWHWIMWSCGLAAMLTEEQIEQHLVALERRFGGVLRKIREYGDLESEKNAVYQKVLAMLDNSPQAQAGGRPAEGAAAESFEPPFRILRKVCIE